MSVREEILQFLRQPAAFARSLPLDSPRLWLRGLENYAQPQIEGKGDYALRRSQIQAWNGLAHQRVGLIQGPPGTGKTYALSWMGLGYLQACQAAGRPCRIFVTAFTLNAIGNLLEAIQGKAERYLTTVPDIAFVGNPPAGGVPPGVQEIPLRGRNGLDVAWELLESEHLVIGCTVWGLQRLLDTTQNTIGERPTAPLFDLVCIDEASQMVVSHGLMALAGLTEGGRVLVAGDDKQLPPVRNIHEQEIEGRRLGGSLYDFLKSAQVAEFPLDETFRLNAPLTHFPERKFYPKSYRAAVNVAENRLALATGWQEGLEEWERIVLDPKFPFCVLLYDGPTAGTSNPFEAQLAVRLTRLLFERMPPAGDDSTPSPEAFWQQRLAVISPHRAQNAAIRLSLARDPVGKGMVVETVDRIQGKERDAIIASYTVADPEFALAEAEFIFSVERLNVTITRARTKLILIVSRRLLDVVPPDEDTLDAAQILRELVFDSREVGSIRLTDNQGARIPVNLRVRGFDDEEEMPAITDTEASTESEPLPEMTRELEELLEAIRQVALTSSYGTAIVGSRELKQRLLRDPPFEQFRDLVGLGYIQLNHRPGRNGSFWTAKPLDPPRQPFSGEGSSVRARLEEVVIASRTSRLPPFYETELRHRFVWMDNDGNDVVWPTIEEMAREGLVDLSEHKGMRRVDWIQAAQEQESPPESPAETLSDSDFFLLNRLEAIEAKRINFGVFEAWTSVAELAAATGRSRGSVSDALRRLRVHAHLLMDEDGRIRSRMAELAREARYVKQRFGKGDANRRPFLVRALKVELRDRDKPVRDRALSTVIQEITASMESEPHVKTALDGLAAMLGVHWSAKDPLLAGFQARALATILPAWLGRTEQDGFVITADTGAGKTEAAILPLIAGAICDSLRGVQGVRAVLVYPRIRLAANQAQRLAAYLAALAGTEGMPTLTLGLQNWQVPTSLERPHESLRDLWQLAGAGGYQFPFFACPSCGGTLHLHRGGGTNGSDRLACSGCRWRFNGWVGDKRGLQTRPPTFFLPVTESLHQWQQDTRYGALFGDRPEFAPPRAVLADEIHLYTHIHGAQVGYTLRRLSARAALNTPGGVRPLAIGMSATLGDPARVWGELSGRGSVMELRPQASERLINPRGREYFYFVQPEVESRGRDVAGASTTIQSLMCLAHGMRRRTGSEGGYRGIAFLDSIDKLKRLHGDYQDAEEAKFLAAYRTRLFDDDPGSQQPRRECCGQPASCDRFCDGECWYFAATDSAQVTARGRYRPGSGLSVARRPVYSGTTGRVEEMIRGADLVFATSSLEVGYDDPDMALVYQHYAPGNLASFVQRKGRGGRGVDDRPVTGVTLSPYSPRDSWYFRRPRRMLDSDQFVLPLNVDNYFVCRGQALSAVLDALARHAVTTGAPTGGIEPDGALNPEVAAVADRLVTACLGDAAYRGLGFNDLASLWASAIAKASQAVGPSDTVASLRNVLPWRPATLFATVDLPTIEVRFHREYRDKEPPHEGILLAMQAATPGNMTRRYGVDDIHWLPPKDGDHPWLTDDDYRGAKGIELARQRDEGLDALLRELPEDARAELGTDIHPNMCQPGRVSLQRAGQMHGAGWTPDWYYDPKTGSVEPLGGASPDEGLKVHPKSRGQLRGCVIVQADDSAAQALPTNGIECLASRFDLFQGGTLDEQRTGLSLSSITWGGDAELLLQDKNRDTVPLTQTFVHPRSGKTLLHGYKVETEGVRLRLNSRNLDDFIDAEVRRMVDHADGRWHRGQMFRYLIGSRSRAVGMNGYEANRAADLLFSCAGHPELRQALNRLVRRWDSQTLKELLLRTYQETLSQHPLLTERRVARVGEAMGAQQFRGVFDEALQQIADPACFAGYLRSVLVNSIAVRLKQAFVLHGHGDERQVVVYAKLPVEYGAGSSDIISVAENSAHGDGTTRMFVEQLDTVVAGWAEGGLAECPNAQEDALTDRVWELNEHHQEWRSLDPRDQVQMAGLAEALLGRPAESRDSMQGVMRLLYGSEAVGAERFTVYDLHSDIRAIAEGLRRVTQRDPTQWELASAAVRAAGGDEPSVLHLTRLLETYRALENASQEESLSPEARLADQVHRVSAHICVDGCPACLHADGALSSRSGYESVTSRRLLSRFLAAVA